MELEINQITVETTEEEEKKEITERRRALVSQLIGKVKSAKQYHKKAFEYFNWKPTDEFSYYYKINE